MSRDTTVLPFRQREAIDDPLSELAREGARRMLAQVLIAEADSFVAMWKDLKLPDGRGGVVRQARGGRPRLCREWPMLGIPADQLRRSSLT
jgi:putative transposase